MKIKNFVTILLVAIILVSCAPAAKVVPTETAIPTSTFTPLPTATITPTPIPTIDIEGQNIPDPRFSNPDFFDVGNTNSPIVQFANAFSIKPEDVIAGLNYYVEQGTNGDNFAVAVSADGIVLLMAEQETNGEFTWQAATPGNYWHNRGKYVGLYLNGYQTDNSYVTKITSEYFFYGILSLSGQVRPNANPERKPSNAIPAFQLAKSSNMALDFHYIAEPEKFPEYTNTNNIDNWLNTRLSETADLVLKSNLSQPVFIEFNEAWEKDKWGRGYNPLKDKYGNNWLREYFYQTLFVFISKGLVPSTDFVLMLNENDILFPEKQRMVHSELIAARVTVFNRLMENQTIKAKLEQMGIFAPEDIDILVGSQTHLLLSPVTDGRDFKWFYASPPTSEDVNNLANSFSDLGGVILTEVNPNVGTDTQKKDFINTIMSVLANNPNLHGIILWNLFNKDDKDIYQSEPLVIFNSDGTPTRLYYELLRH